MSQHDGNLANQIGSAFRADLNNALGAAFTNHEGATAPATMFPSQWWPDTTAGVLKQRNSANSAWVIRATLADPRTFSRSSNTILAVADFDCWFRATAPFTQTLTAAATLGDGWRCHYRVDAGAIVTLDPNGSENIDGATTKVLVGPTSGSIYCSGGTAFFTTGFSASTSSFPRSYLAGCAIANNAGDATNDIDFAVGVCRDSTDTVNIICAAMTKRLDAGLAPGTNQGMRNSAAAITNATYHLYAVSKADGTQDYYAHTSTTVATVITALQAESGGADYLYARRIGSIVRTGGAIKAFVQDGDLFQLTTLGADISATDPGISPVTRTMASIPTGLILRGIFLVTLAGTSTGDKFGLLSDLRMTDQAPSNGTANFATTRSVNASDASGAQVEVMTNTSAQIRSRISASEAATVLTIRTRGWIDTRGRDA